MLNKQEAEGRYQISAFSLDELVPEDHLVRKIENAIDFCSSMTWWKASTVMTMADPVLTL